MIYSKDAELLREDARLRGKKLSAAERAKLVKPYLPSPSPAAAAASSRRPGSKKQKAKPKPVRTFLKSQVHRVIYVIIHLVLGFYVRVSQTLSAVRDRILAITYHHHRTPELIKKDVKGLSRLPEHLSVLLKLRKEEDALHTLMDEAAELAAWTTCAEIPVLSVYERTGKPVPTTRKYQTILNYSLKVFSNHACLPSTKPSPRSSPYTTDRL